MIQNLKGKKILDRYLGGLAMMCLFPFAFLIGQLKKRELKIGDKIVFIKLFGGGSLAVAYPSLLRIRLQYPKIKFYLITTHHMIQFIDVLGLFDEVICLNDRSIITFITTMWKAFIATFRTKIIIDLEIYSQFTTLFSFLILGRVRIGAVRISSKWHQVFYTHPILTSPLNGVHLFYDQISELLKAKTVSFELTQNHFLNYFHSLVGPALEKKPFTISLGCACSELSKERMLTPSQWVNFFRIRIAKSTVTEVRILGGKKDRDMAEKLTETFKKEFPQIRFVNTCGDYSLAQTLHQLQSCHEYWGIDSALLHFSRLMNIRSASIWGPTDPKILLQPIPGLIEEIIYKKIPCSPCVHIVDHPPCKGDNLCINQLFDSNLKPPRALSKLPREFKNH